MRAVFEVRHGALDRGVMVPDEAHEYRDRAMRRVRHRYQVGVQGNRFGRERCDGWHQWSPPSNWATAWAMSAGRTSIADATPVGEPGRLMTIAGAGRAVTPASPRESA